MKSPDAWRNIKVFILLASVFLTAACSHGVVSIEPPPLSIPAQPGDLHVLAGEWEITDASGAALRLIIDGQGNGHYDWKDGRFETQTLIDHTWNGMWFQKENDRDGGFTVEFSPDFSEGEGQWWYNRIGSDTAPIQKGGSFHLKSTTG